MLTDRKSGKYSLGSPIGMPFMLYLSTLSTLFDFGFWRHASTCFLASILRDMLAKLGADGAGVRAFSQRLLAWSAGHFVSICLLRLKKTF